MAVTSATYQDTIEQIKSIDDEYPGRLTESMSSSEFNKITEAIETRLNSIYEKMRLLEDAKDYCKNYLVRQIDEKKAAFREKLRMIENASDAYNDKAAVTIAIPFTSFNGTILDRDGTQLPLMEIDGASLEMPSGILSSAKIASVEHSSDTACYDNTYSSLLNGNPGRSLYMSWDPVPGGVSEECIVMFKESVLCNHIDIKISNCTAENIRLLTSAGEVSIYTSSGFFSEQEVNGVKFTLSCKDFATTMMGVSEQFKEGGIFVPSDYGRNGKEELVRNMQEKQGEIGLSLESEESQVKLNEWKRDMEIRMQKNIKMTESGADPSSYEYQHEKGNQEIDSSRIVLKDNAGIIQTLGEGGFQFIPDREISKTASEFVSEYQGAEPPLLPERPDASGFFPDAPSGQTMVQKAQFEYLFGIDDISLEYRIYDRTAAFLSEKVIVDSASFLQLSVSNGSAERSIEWSIIEGEKETPIAPLECSRVLKERVFQGLPPRFQADSSSYVEVIRNGDSVDVSFDDITGLSDADSVEYSVSYRPIGQSYYYYPEKGAEIQVKAIERCHDDELPAPITSIVMQKFGGDSLWNI